MAEFYEVLGLDAPPKDRRDVKKAYSKKLKVTRPEDDPDGFMRLRDAHDYALNWLSWKNEPQIIIDDHSSPDPSYEDDDTIDPEISLSPPPDTVTAEEISPTAYSLGSTPSLEAPLQTQIEPAPPPLDAEIIALLHNEESRNKREAWNSLFRKARELDIDDYVDFENLLLHRILELHDFYEDNNANFETPEKLPKRLNPSITASLFKTMHWDEVAHSSPQKEYRIGWLERRMGIRKTNTSQFVQGPQTPENTPRDLARWFWPALALIFALALMSDLITG